MISDDDRLPRTVGGLFVVAGGLYGRRWPLYLSLAALAMVVQYAVDVLLPHTQGLVTGLGIVIDAFFMAAVSIGVAFDLALKDADWSTVLLAASERWGAVAVTGLFYYLTFLSLAPYVFGPPDDFTRGFVILPIFVFWGAVWMGQVAAAIEPGPTRLTLPFLAIGKGMAVSLRWKNLGRLVLLSLLIVVQYFLDDLLGGALLKHHVPNVDFWASVPMDALTTGPLQVLSTVFYIDFLRRAKR